MRPNSGRSGHEDRRRQLFPSKCTGKTRRGGRADLKLVRRQGIFRVLMKFVALHVLPKGRSGAPVYNGAMLGGAVLSEEPIAVEDSQDSDDQDAEERVFKIQKPIRDLLHAEIDHSQNILGNFFLERGHYTVLVGPSGIGKSVVAVQMAIEAAAGLHVFGMPIPEPLRVVLVQAEDSDNDLKLQVRCIETIAHSEEVQERLGLSPEDIKERIENNLTVVTTNVRGAALFTDLRKEFTNRATGKSKVDLVIFNPAFAFLEGSASSDLAVNTFLRKQLQSFLRRMQAAGVVVHHTVKPPRRGTAKRSAETTMYSSEL
jgi:RecA-family ATPase